MYYYTYIYYMDIYIYIYIYLSFMQTKCYQRQLLSYLMAIHIEKQYVLFHSSTKLASSSSERNKRVNETFK